MKGLVLEEGGEERLNGEGMIGGIQLILVQRERGIHRPPRA